MWCIRKEVSVFICLAPEEDYPSFLFIFSFFFLSFFFSFLCPGPVRKHGRCSLGDIHRFYFCQHLTHVGLMPQTRRLCRLL